MQISHKPHRHCRLIKFKAELMTPPALSLTPSTHPPPGPNLPLCMSPYLHYFYITPP